MFEHVPAPDQVGAGVRLGEPFGDAPVDADAGGDLGFCCGQGFQGASRVVEVAAHGLDAMHGEPEPAGQLDAEVGFAGSDIQGSRARRQAEFGDQLGEQVESARAEALVQGRLEGLFLGEG